MSSCPFGFSSENKETKTDNSNEDSLKQSTLELFLLENYDKNFLPKKPQIYLDWWEQDEKTKGHAKFCMPLLMANGIGYDILSPATFEVAWDGDEMHDARVKILDKCTHGIVDTHSAYGSLLFKLNLSLKQSWDILYMLKECQILDDHFQSWKA